MAYLWWIYRRIILVSCGSYKLCRKNNSKLFYSFSWIRINRSTRNYNDCKYLFCVLYLFFHPLSSSSYVSNFLFMYSTKIHSDRQYNRIIHGKNVMLQMIVCDFNEFNFFFGNFAFSFSELSCYCCFYNASIFYKCHFWNIANIIFHSIQRTQKICIRWKQQLKPMKGRKKNISDKNAEHLNWSPNNADYTENASSNIQNG